MLAGPRAPCPSPPRGVSAPTGTARAVPSAERTETHRVAAGENRPRPPRPPSAPTSPARVAWAVPGGLRPVHLRTRLRSVQRPQKVEAGLARGRRLLCRVRSAKARARVPSWGARLPPSLCPRRRARVMRRSQTTRPSSRVRAPVPVDSGASLRASASLGSVRGASLLEPLL